MARKVLSYMFQNKTPIILICMVGIVAVSYGMLNDSNLVFVIGLLFVIGGYLLIRRRTKDYIKKNL